MACEIARPSKKSACWGLYHQMVQVYEQRTTQGGTEVASASRMTMPRAILLVVM